MIEAKLMPLPHRLKGYVCETCGDYTVILNSRLSREQNKETYLHELEHIDCDDLRSLLSADEIEETRHK